MKIKNLIPHILSGLGFIGIGYALYRLSFVICIIYGSLLLLVISNGLRKMGVK